MALLPMRRQNGSRYTLKIRQVAFLKSAVRNLRSPAKSSAKVARNGKGSG